MTANIIVVVLMVLLSACFSASEISFNTANKKRLKKAGDEGKKSAKLAYNIIENFNTALSAILIGNNLANIACTTAATVIAFSLISNEGVASVASTVVMTVIILIFGEIVPKIVAKNNADVMVHGFAYIITVVKWILYPLVWLVMALIKGLEKLWGKDDEDAPTVTEEELSSIIETVEEEGVIDEDKKELLQSAIIFRDTTVEEIMTPRIDMLAFDITHSLDKLRRIAEESRFSRIPVYDESIDDIIGVLYLNRYYRRITGEGVKNKTELRELLMEPLFIHKTMKLNKALNMLRERKTHLAIVVDEYGGTMGVVTIEDILEELVGEIWDESDEIVTELVKTGNNTYEVSGDMNIDDFFAEIEFEPKEFECEYSTVGGWAIEMLNADPHLGDNFKYSDLDEEALEDDDYEGHTELYVIVSGMDDMRIKKLTVLVTRIEPEEKDKEKTEE
ncbi:MAG: HlyC/CorC family transporter [Ruminococcaceae bacterium]|nr:HlyC/CorC family transporter [Oscillospiraceae bacterium]